MRVRLATPEEMDALDQHLDQEENMEMKRSTRAKVMAAVLGVVTAISGSSTGDDVTGVKAMFTGFIDAWNTRDGEILSQSFLPEYSVFSWDNFFSKVQRPWDKEQFDAFFEWQKWELHARDVDVNVYGETAVLTCHLGGSITVHSWAIDSTTVGKRRGFLGAQVSVVTAEKTAEVGLEAPRGLLINFMFEDMAAHKAGLKRGDVLLAINDAPLETVSDLQKVWNMLPGTVVQLTLWRDGKEEILPIELGELPFWRLTVVLVKRDERWKIAHWHCSEILNSDTPTLPAYFGGLVWEKMHVAP
jgi:hypothetical protein